VVVGFGLTAPAAVLLEGEDDPGVLGRAGDADDAGVAPPGRGAEDEEYPPPPLPLPDDEGNPPLLLLLPPDDEGDEPTPPGRAPATPDDEEDEEGADKGAVPPGLAPPTPDEGANDPDEEGDAGFLSSFFSGSGSPRLNNPPTRPKRPPPPESDFLSSFLASGFLSSFLSESPPRPGMTDCTRDIMPPKRPPLSGSGFLSSGFFTSGFLSSVRAGGVEAGRGGSARELP